MGGVSRGKLTAQTPFQGTCLRGEGRGDDPPPPGVRENDLKLHLCESTLKTLSPHCSLCPRRTDSRRPHVGAPHVRAPHVGPGGWEGATGPSGRGSQPGHRLPGSPSCWMRSSIRHSGRQDTEGWGRRQGTGHCGPSVASRIR